MYARAALAAALALLISGDAVRLGWSALHPWHYVFPYLWFFVLLEVLRHRRRVSDAVIFSAGATLGLFYGGIYAKDLQHGFHPFGVDWLSIPCAMFDWGMLAVVASHIAVRLLPRHEEVDSPPISTVVFLVFGLGAVAIIYGVHTIFNFYRADRMLGPTWLLADLVFAWLAWKMSQRTLALAEADEEGERLDWMWAVAAVAIFLPGARITARVCALIELPTPLTYFFVLAWTAGLGFLAWRLWKERGHFSAELVSDSRYAKAVGVWRLLGAILLIFWFREDPSPASVSGTFSALIDLPTRALFALAFLTARLKV